MKPNFKVILFLLASGFVVVGGLVAPKSVSANHSLNCNLGLSRVDATTVHALGTVSSPLNDHFNMEINWGDGGGWLFWGTALSSGANEDSHVYGSNGLWTVQIRATGTGYPDPFDIPQSCSASGQFNSAVSSTINVTSNRNTCWTITGPENKAGCGDSGSYAVATGTYTIAADNLAGYTLSVNPASKQQTLNAGETKTFTLTYTSTTNPPGAISVSGSSCFGWPSPKIEVNFGPDVAGNYELHRSVNGGGYAIVFSGNYSQLDAYADPVSAPNTYVYFVRAINSVGTSDTAPTAPITVSESACGGTPPGPPLGSNCNQDALLTVLTPLPSTVTAGQSYPISISARNSGDTWFGNGSTKWYFDIGPSTSPAPGGDWAAYVSPRRFNLNMMGGGWGRPYSVSGGTGVANMTFTAPNTPGATYTLTWKMQQVNMTNAMEYALISNPPNTTGPDGSDCSTWPVPPPQGTAAYFGNEVFITTTVVATPPPPAGSGNIFVNSDTPTSWTVAGSTTSYAGAYPSTTASYTGAPLGSYTITAPSLGAGYAGPEYTPLQTQTLNNASSITFNLSYLAGPTNLNLNLSSQCNRVLLNWTDNANNETKYEVYRSTDNQASWTKISDRPANSTSYTDATASGNNNNFYTVRAVKGSLWIQTPVESIFVPGCSANIGNSTKTFYKVNGVAMSPTVTIKDADTVTFRVTIINSDTATDSATINGITDALSSSLTNIRNITLDKGSGPVSIASLANVTGTMLPATNWLVQFDTTAVVNPSTDSLFKNQATINCVSTTSGTPCSVTRIATYLNTKGSSKAPTFREVAP